MAESSVFMTIARTLELPLDVVAGEPSCYMLGNRLLFFRNSRGISDFSNGQLRIRGNRCDVLVTGRELAISSYHKDEIIISGIVEHLEIASGSRSKAWRKEK